VSATSLLVLGDLCIDTVVPSPLSMSWHELSASEERVFRVPLDERPGGSAFQFGRYAAAVGMQPLVVGCLGSDLAADAMVAALAMAGCRSQIQRTESAPTARSVVTFDASGTRLLITTERSANDLLSADYVRSLALSADRPSLVWLPGHCLRDQTAPRWRAVISALDCAREAGARVVLDVVPHNFYQHFAGIDDVQSLIGPLDGISAELDSVRRWLGVGWAHASPCPEALADAVSAVLDMVPFTIVRYHDGSTYQQLARARTGFRATEVRAVPEPGGLVGYGDYLASLAVRDYLAHLETPAAQTERTNL
jgi:sugar/nucleoside kinase (ribokinase family)